MKRLDLPTLWDYWTSRLSAGEFDEDELLAHYDKLRDAIYAAAKEGGCYWELVPANCFYNPEHGEITFFDQEYCRGGENLNPTSRL
jgi:hypothetical protein